MKQYNPEPEVVQNLLHLTGKLNVRYMSKFNYKDGLTFNENGTISIEWINGVDKVFAEIGVETFSMFHKTDTGYISYDNCEIKNPIELELSLETLFYYEMTALAEDDKEYREFAETILKSHYDTIEFLQSHVSDESPLLAKGIEQKIKHYTRLIADIKKGMEK
jgi:hypothetical protein